MFPWIRIPGEVLDRDVKIAIAERASNLRKHNDQLRGVGIWPGPAGTGEIVLCNGSHLSVWDGSELRKIERAIYHGQPYVIGTGKHWYDHDELAELCKLAVDPAWRREQARPLMKCLQQWSAKQKVAPMVAGMVLSTLRQACLKWRPHIAITGKSQSGKSTLAELLSGIFGSLALVTTDTTKAGVLQSLKNDSRATMIDEWDSHAATERTKIMKLMRGSTGATGQSIRGTVSQLAKREKLNHCVWLLGVYASADRDVDANRIIQIDLNSPTHEKRRAFRYPTDEEVEHWRKVMAAIAIVTVEEASAASSKLHGGDAGESLCDRQRKNLAIITAAYATGMCDESAETAYQLICEPFAADDDARVIPDHERLLDELLGSTIDLGRGERVTVANAITQRCKAYDDALGLAGLKVDTTDEGDQSHECLYVARYDGSELKPANLRKVLEGCEAITKRRRRIGGKLCRCVEIPFSHLAKFGVERDT